MMYTRMISTSAAAAMALLASACSDRLTAPAAVPGAPALTAASSGPTLIPNSVRYRDTGGKPATGRAGSAVVDALALLGRDGYTDLELRARPADPASSATGTVERAQVKVYDETGALRITRNAAGGQPVRIGGLLPGTRIDAQANVTGIDPNRTDVVSVSQTVRMRPDLSVTLGVDSRTIHTGAPAVIVASVNELNGQLGAEANCVLRVNGEQVDQARGIWVDAGGRVDCAFTTQPMAEGVHTLTVALEGVRPGDWNAVNNTASVQVVARTPAVPLSYETWVRGETYSQRFSWRVAYFDGVYGQETRTEQGQAGFLHLSRTDGYIGRGFAGPVSFRVTESSGGHLMQDDAWTEADLGGGGSCFERWNSTQATWLYFCSNPATASTTFQFVRNSGTVTYHSRGYQREWDASTGNEYVYHWSNTDVSSFGPPDPLANDYHFRLSVVAQGEETLVQADVELARDSGDWVEPEWCYGSGDESSGWYYRTCMGSESHFVILEGFRFYSLAPGSTP